MPFIKNTSGNHIIDENGNKIEFTVSYSNHLNLNSNNHLDTNNHHLIIKDAINDSHAISLGGVKKILANQPSDDPTPNIITQVDQKILQMKTNLINDIHEYIETEIHKNQIQILETMKTLFNDLKLVNVVSGVKTGNIPTTSHQWHKLIGEDDIPNSNNALRIMIMNLYIKRWDRFHNAASELVHNVFGDLELFFNADENAYYIYFSSYPSGWSTDYKIEWLAFFPANFKPEINIEII